LSVFDNLELATASNKSVWYTLTHALTGTQRDRIDEVLELIGLADQRRQLAGALSHGQKQWLEIGMLLMQNPRVLLVDEPVAGMTGEEVEHTAALLTSLAGRHSVIVVEHDMAFVRSIARKVTVLHQGSVLAEGTMDQVQNDPRVIEVYRGEGAGCRYEASTSSTIRAISSGIWTCSSGKAPAAACSGATAWARPRCSSASWACCRSATGRSCSRAGTSPACPPSIAPGAASAMCPRAGRSSRC